MYNLSNRLSYFHCKVTNNIKIIDISSAFITHKKNTLKNEQLIAN